MELEGRISHLCLLSSEPFSSFSTSSATRSHDHVCFEVVILAVNSMLGGSVHMDLSRVIRLGASFSSVKSNSSSTIEMETFLV